MVKIVPDSTVFHELFFLCVLSLLLVSAGCTTSTPGGSPSTAPESPPATTVIPVAVVSTQAPTQPPSAPAATIAASFPPGVRPVGLTYEFRDNYGKQVVGVRVKSYAVQNQYNYYYDDAYAPEATVNAPQGHKFLFVGVTWDLVGVVGGGSRTFFMTPNTTSYRLFYAGTEYEPLYPFNLENPMHYYIKNQGSIVMEERIDKDNSGSGVLVFEVPSTMAAKDGYVTFCPKNELIWDILGYPHSPNNWDCNSNTISWKLV
ncbi:MAG TPA: hypothetical protein VMB35_03130 [Methanomicrobiales archaeon]|nr:hypothetical protein [Methanomicrobiales archaeon]